MKIILIIAVSFLIFLGCADTTGDSYTIDNSGNGNVTVSIGDTTTTTTSSGLCVVNENNTTRPCTQKEIDGTTNVLNRTTDALYRL